MIIVDKENELCKERMRGWCYNWCQEVTMVVVKCCVRDEECLLECWLWKKFLMKVEALLLLFAVELKVVAQCCCWCQEVTVVRAMFVLLSFMAGGNATHNGRWLLVSIWILYFSSFYYSESSQVMVFFCFQVSICWDVIVYEVCRCVYLFIL